MHVSLISLTVKAFNSCRAGLYVPHVFSSEVLQVTRGRLFPREERRLHVDANAWYELSTHMHTAICKPLTCSHMCRCGPFLGFLVLGHTSPRAHHHLSRDNPHSHLTLLVPPRSPLLPCAGGTLLTALAPFVHVQFLGSSLTFMMVYVWGRRHQYVNLSFLGIFNFTAPYLPWVLLAFSFVLGSSPVVDLLGMAAGDQGSGMMVKLGLGEGLLECK